MFRGPQILTWSCPFKSLLSLRESHFAACCENTGWQGARAAKERRHEVGSLSSTETLSCSTQLPLFTLDCDNQELKDASVQKLSKAISSSRYHHPSQVSAAAKARQAVSIDRDCLINTTCFQPLRRSRDFCQTPLSLTNKPQRTVLQSHSYDKEHFVRSFSLSAHQPWVLNHLHWKARPSGVSFHQTRAAYHSAPRVAGAWRSCLTPENENRCRQNLGPNLKLYEADGGRKGASQSQGKRQAKWASVLVSLCSVEGEPAFLFTLRSSTLKGRHKGDVSFAGGKCDPSDKDVVATALREAREELGVNVATERVWGILKPLRDSSGMMIAPVLANLGPLEELSFKPNPEEVEEIFTLSLSHLCNPQNRGYTHFRTGEKYGYTLPVFRNGKHRVWGLTAVALDHTLTLVVPKVDFQ